MAAAPARKTARLAAELLEGRDVPAAHALYAVTQDWGGGFQGQVRLSNDGPAPVAFDTLQFALPSNITSIWDAKLVSHTGNSYTVTNAGWDATIPAGGSVSFGFTAARGTSTAATAFVLGGVPLHAAPTLPPVSPPASPPISPPASPPVTPPTSGTQVSFAVTSDWGSGMNGEIVVRNTGTAAVTGWKVSFDFPAQITSLWNGTIVSRVGNRYTVAATAWNGTIPAGGSVSIGFGAGRGGVAATDFAVTTAGSTSPPVSPPPATNHAPTAVGDAASTPAGQAVQVKVLANDADRDGDTLTVVAAGPAGHGAVAVNKDGSVTYTPAAGYTGADTFGYSVNDGKGGIAYGTVNVQVTAAPVTPPASAPAWPAHVFAPYVDATAWPTYDFVATARATGVKYYTLAFVTADTGNKPAWGGYASLGTSGSEFSTQIQTQIAALRALGGDVAVSFGGASGRELAQVITTVADLTAAYRSVIQTYGLTHVDFDIEGTAGADRASIDRRNQAIAILQQEAGAGGRELSVRFTLAVLPTGLDAAGLYVLQSAKAYGVRVDLVNIMAMDYGDNAAPNPQGRMGEYAIQAATSLYSQLAALYGSGQTEAKRWAMIGVTPMIGLNDVTTETFTQQDARRLEAWAAQHQIGLLSMWSLNRDRQNAGGAVGYVDTNSSSVTQTPNEFSSIFVPFTK